MNENEVNQARKIEYDGVEIERLKGVIRRLERQLHGCCISALGVGEMARQVGNRGEVDNVVVAVGDATQDIYHKYDYRVSGYDAEDIILGNDFDK